MLIAVLAGTQAQFESWLRHNCLGDKSLFLYVPNIESLRGKRFAAAIGVGIWDLNKAYDDKFFAVLRQELWVERNEA